MDSAEFHPCLAITPSLNKAVDKPTVLITIHIRTALCTSSKPWTFFYVSHMSISAHSLIDTIKPIVQKFPTPCQLDTLFIISILVCRTPLVQLLFLYLSPSQSHSSLLSSWLIDATLFRASHGVFLKKHVILQFSLAGLFWSPTPASIALFSQFLIYHALLPQNGSHEGLFLLPQFFSFSLRGLSSLYCCLNSPQTCSLHRPLIILPLSVTASALDVYPTHMLMAS